MERGEEQARQIDAGRPLGLPSTTFVGRAMPKTAFYEHLKIDAAIKQEFVQLIDKIELTAAIKEASVHIPATADVQEIDVLTIVLKDGTAVPAGAIELIARSVPNKVLFVCLMGEMCKLIVFRSGLHENGWTSVRDAHLTLKGYTLAEVWDSICSQMAFGTDEPEDFDGRLARSRRIETLRQEIGRVERKRASERQIKKRNDLFDQLRSLKRELSQLEETL